MQIKSNVISASGIAQELANRRTKALSVQAGTPRIGIFWLHKVNGQIELFNDIAVTIDKGEESEGFITAKDQHYSEWNKLKRIKYVPENSDFEYLPRGRILFHKDTHNYLVILGSWSTPQCESVIKNGFNLPLDLTYFDSHPHYEKFVPWTLPERDK